MGKINKITRTLVATAVFGVVGAAQAADEVEVLHWWTSGGEAAALKVLKGDLEGQGIGWKDMPVAGGGGTSAMTVLRARVTSGKAPTAVQMLGFDITDWAMEGVLGDLNTVAEVHSTNWVWANKCTRPTGSGPTKRSWMK